MEDASKLSNPYAHMKRAKALEDEQNLRAAESQWRAAVRAADSLPLEEYRSGLNLELVRYAADPSYQSSPGVSREDLTRAYSEVLALPFLTRIELAGFYGRNAAYPEALDVCLQAFVPGPDAECLKDPRIHEMYQRAKILRMSIEEMIGPEDLEKTFRENMGTLDRDGDGFVDHEELSAARFDLRLSPECQLLIRHLLCHYFEIEAAHHDEWGIDISGISLKDVQEYGRSSASNWRRMGKNKPRKTGRKLW
jgi:hypothetical protein